MTWEIAINSIEIAIHQLHKELVFTIKTTYKWRGTGTVLLRGDDLVLLEKWRDLVPGFAPNLNTFPRDALLLSDELTVMMKSDLVSFKTEFLMSSLFSRNLTLKGRACVTCSKQYGKTDFTLMHESKDGWRLCYLEGDTMFMQSLKQHTLDTKFEVGCGLVTIRGGVRKPSFLHKNFAALPWNQTHWLRTPRFPWLRSLQPIPRENLQTVTSSSSVKVDKTFPPPQMEAVSPGILRTASAPAPVGKPIERCKPRTRSERIKLQKAKKLAFKRRVNVKTVV